MPAPARAAQRVALVAVIVAVSSWASPAHAEWPQVDAAALARVQKLDCARLDSEEAVDALRTVPAPHVVLLQGSLGIVTMAPFAEFLVAMGYPEGALRDPRDATMRTDSSMSGEEVAGMLAWYYEREGLRPMAIGHSRGGGVVIRALHALAGRYGDIPVWNPVERAAEARTTFRDPRTGAERPVVGLRLPFAAALATGKLMRVLTGQWDMLPILRRVPDSSETFTGFAIPFDPIAGTGAEDDPYVATGSAQVRNVTLPTSSSHIGLPRTAHLANQPSTRAWIEHYAPTAPAAPPPESPGVDTTNLLLAAELWSSLKQHWCNEAQRALAPRSAAR